MRAEISSHAGSRDLLERDRAGLLPHVTRRMHTDRRIVGKGPAFNPYGNAHQLRRRGITPLVEAGLATYPRCGKRIKPGEPWDLGHVDGTNRTVYSGAEHRKCNRQNAGAGRVSGKSWPSVHPE
jgi:hypothetical protein